MFVDKNFLVMLAACTLGIAYALWTFFGLKGVAIWFALVVGFILYTERERPDTRSDKENQSRRVVGGAGGVTRVEYGR